MPIGAVIGNVVAQHVQSNLQRSAAAQAALHAQAALNAGLGNPHAPWNTSAGNFTGMPVGGFSGIGGFGWSGMPTAQVEYRDPFEYACEVALKQPADKKWRRFQHAMFLLDDVIGIHAEGSGSIGIRFHHKGSDSPMSDYQFVFTLPFDCGDPVQWFAEHVLNMEFPNAKRAI